MMKETVVLRKTFHGLEFGRVVSVGPKLVMVVGLLIGTDGEFRDSWNARWPRGGVFVATPESIEIGKRIAAIDRAYRIQEQDLHAARAAEIAPLLEKIKGGAQ